MMRVAMDSLSATALPDFVRMYANADTDVSADLRVAVFNAFNAQIELPDLISQMQPDVIVVDAAWLAIAPLLHHLIDRSELPNVRPAVASSAITDVLKIEATYQGMFDVVNMRDTPDQLRLHFLDIHAGNSRLERDPLWERIAKPVRSPEIASAPLDSVDQAILELVRIGLRDHEIAIALHYSEQSVKNRLSAMLRRAGLGNRTQLAWSFSNQLLVARMTMGLDNQRRNT